MNQAHAPDGASTAPAENTAAAKHLGGVIKRLHRHISSRVMQDMQAELTELDLSFSQMTALHHLRATGATSVTQLSEGTLLSLPAASHLVERLVQRGLVQRDENPGNRREKVVSLTPAGQNVLDRMDAAFVEAYVYTLSGLRLQTIQTATDHLLALVDEIDPDATDRARAPLKENP